MKKFLMVTIITAASLSATDLVLADEGSGCHFHGNTAATPETVASCALQRKETLG